MNLKVGFCLIAASAAVSGFVSACQTTKETSHAALTANAQFGNFAQAPVPAAEAVLIPQWHLPPQVNTRQSSKPNPQDENQFAIYSQLSEWISQKNLSTVLVEGCEGEIQDGFSERFNGWTLAELKALPVDTLERVDTQIGLKLKAKFKDAVRVLCGDDLSLIKQNQLDLSDLRGLIGFKIRIDSARADVRKREEYISAARDVLKMPVESTPEHVTAKINTELKLKLDDFEAVIHRRNEAFVKAAARVQNSPYAIVIGAIHIDDLKTQIPSSLLYTPKGLRGDEADLIRQARTLITQ